MNIGQMVFSMSTLQIPTSYKRILNSSSVSTAPGRQQFPDKYCLTIISWTKKVYIFTGQACN